MNSVELVVVGIRNDRQSQQKYLVDPGLIRNQK